MQELSDLRPVPLYLQLAALLRRKIEQGQLHPGDALPTEADLCQRYGISRATARQALGLLSDEGLILRQRGRGSTVASSRPLTYAVTELRGFTESLVAQGLAPRAQLLSLGARVPPEEVALMLGLGEGEQTLHFRRLVSVDDRPLLLDGGDIPVHYDLRFDSKILGAQPIYRLIEAALGAPLAGVRQTIAAIAAAPEQAALLDVAEGAPLLRVTRLAFPERGRPILYGVGVFRADRYQEHLWLRRPGAPAHNPAVQEQASPSVSKGVDKGIMKEER